MNIKTPSFYGLKPASIASSRSKQANRSENGRSEIILRKTLYRMGLRYRKNVKTLVGVPDIVFLKAHVIVFCDGDFWHGRNWKQLKNKLAKGTNGRYWIQKIQANIFRDRRINKLLGKLGWSVIRVWETDILSSPVAIAKRIATMVHCRNIY